MMLASRPEAAELASPRLTDGSSSCATGGTTHCATSCLRVHANGHSFKTTLLRAACPPQVPSTQAAELGEGRGGIDRTKATILRWASHKQIIIRIESRARAPVAAAAGLGKRGQQ